MNKQTTTYYWLNGSLDGQKTGDEYLFFLYDETGTIYGFTIKNGTSETTYYYDFNLQGDVVGIIDSNGTKVVEYSYDVWGKPLTVTGTMADTIGQKNPIRYRGYYYDEETGFYYLKSRYYDPEIGRFLNADGALYCGELGCNLFAYCDNNFVNYYDPTGNDGAAVLGGWLSSMWWLILIDGPIPLGDVVYVGIAVIGVCVFNKLVEKVKEKVKSENKKDDNKESKKDDNKENKKPKLTSEPPRIKYPGNDPTKCETPGFEWKGSGTVESGKGNFVNTETGEWLHPDLDHELPIGPHWDYGIRGSSQIFRIFPDGTISPK